MPKTLGIPVILVGSGKDKSKKELVTNLNLAYDTFMDKEVKVLGVVANKVDEDSIDEVAKDLKAAIEEKIFIGVIPMIKSLNNPTIKEIVDELDAEILIGEDQLDNQVESKAVGAMQLRNFFNPFKIELSGHHTGRQGGCHIELLAGQYL